MSRSIACALLLLYSIGCMSAEYYFLAFDFRTCTPWEFTTDIVAYKNPEYIAAAARVKKLQEDQPDWAVYEAVNEKTWKQGFFGVCRYVFHGTVPNERPAKFQCDTFGSLPISGSSFSVVKARGLYSSTYRCTTSCRGKSIQVIHDKSSEDEGNVELSASRKKFSNMCQWGGAKK